MLKKSELYVPKYLLADLKAHQNLVNIFSKYQYILDFYPIGETLICFDYRVKVGFQV